MSSTLHMAYVFYFLWHICFAHPGPFTMSTAVGLRASFLLYERPTWFTRGCCSWVRANSCCLPAMSAVVPTKVFLFLLSMFQHRSVLILARVACSACRYRLVGLRGAQHCEVPDRTSQEICSWNTRLRLGEATEFALYAG